MSKRMSPPINQTSTHPATREIDTGRKGEVGSVAPSKQPLPSISEMQSRSQKVARPQIQVTFDTVGQVTPADREGIPAAVTPGSGFSLNDTPAGGLGEFAGLGAGDDVAAVSPPQAAPASTIASVATQARADVIAARHRVPALPQQVTGTPREIR